MPAEPENQPSPSDITVCIVDPDEELARRTGAMLEPLGVRPLVFSTGAALLAGAPPCPACVICELRLPDMTAVELMQELRERQVAAPVIVLAGDGDVATAVTVMRAGALDFVEKPQADRLLVWHVRRLLESFESASRPGPD